MASSMSSDIFIISAARDADTPTGIGQAIDSAGLRASQIQDAVFGLDDSSAMPDTGPAMRAAGLSCPAVCIAPSLRAIFFAAASILSDDVELSLVIGLGSGTSLAFILASPEAVGRLNLLPCARIAARSLAGLEPALRTAGVTSSDIDITKTGEHVALLLYELLEELDAKMARWGLLSGGEATMLVERV